jgi:membrane-associated phospholipid phosphatase
MRQSRTLLFCAALFFASATPRAFALAGWEETAGDVLTGAIPITAYWYTYHYDDPEGRKQFYWCVGSNEVVNSALRLAFNQTELGKRPNGHEYGFPSGHVGFIMSGAGFLAVRYGWRFGLPAYAASTYVAYTRVETEHHRWRDVLAAAVVAQGIANLTVTSKNRPEVTPMIGSNYVGLEWNHPFGGS